MKSKDQTLLEEAYQTIKEEASPRPVKDIFDAYEDIGMSAEMGIDELITSSVQHILKIVPQEDQAAARIAVKNLWKQKIEDWKSFEGYGE